MENIKRIHLLSGTEIEELYARPEFSEHEQNLYFSLTKQQFFNLSFDEVSHDVQYIVSACYSDTDMIRLKGALSRKYRYRQQQAILSLFGYRNWSPQYTAETESHLACLLRYYPKGHNAFRQLLAYFEHQKLVLPSYRILQDIFSHAFVAEENRLNAAISLLPAAITEQLAALVQRDDSITALNIIRADQKDFQYTAVRMEADKALRIEDLYQFSRGFLPSLALSKNAVRY